MDGALENMQSVETHSFLRIHQIFLNLRTVFPTQTSRLVSLRRQPLVVHFKGVAVDMVSQDGRHTTRAWIATQSSQRQLHLCEDGSLEILSLRPFSPRGSRSTFIDL